MLSDGRQFLYRTMQSSPGVWFGGEDDGRRFLVQLRPDKFEHFKRGGEQEFYGDLVPKTISTFRYRYSVQEAPIRRGSLFAIPLGCSWDELQRYHLLFHGIWFDKRDARGEMLFVGDHHRFVGTSYNMQLLGLGEHIVFEGTLTSPGREPLELKEPHLICRTEGLIE